MANLSDSEDIQCVGFDHDYYQEAACAHHEEHVMHDCVQLDHVVDSHDDYTSDSNIILCDQYVRDNDVPVIHSGASSVPTDAFMMIYDDIPVSTDVSKTSVIRPKQVKPIVTKTNSPPKRHTNRSSFPKVSNSPPRVTAVKAPVDKGVIDSGCSRHMIGNMSYLSGFEELNGGYVTFGGNPKGGNISRKGNLVRGLPTKVFKNDHTCVACKKGKQHRASCKTKPASSVDQPLYMLHMDLFGPTFVKSLNKKSYFLVITDDYSRFTWVFFLATKDDTSPILKTFITGLENQPSIKTSGFERPRDPVLQILWGIVTQSNIDYTERIWEEFTQSIHTFIEDKRNLSRHTTGKKRATLILIPSIRFTKLIIHRLQRRHRGFLAGDTGSTQDLPAPKPAKPARKPSISIPVASTQPAPTSAPAKSQEYKRKQATETTDKPAKAKRFKRSISRKTRQPRSSPKSVGASEAKKVPAEEPQVADEDADYQKAMEESIKVAYALPKGPLPPMVIREPESGKYQPLPEVPGKGKAKTSPADQYIFQRQVSEPTESSFHDESPYDVLVQSDSEEESEKVALGAEKGGQDKGQAGPDPDAQAEDQTGSDAGAQAEGQARSNPDETSEGKAGSNPDETSECQAGPDPGDAEARVQSISSPVVHAGSDHPSLPRNISNLKQPQPAVESMVNVTIQQALSSIPLMTSPIIDLTSRPESPKEHQQLKATTTGTTTTTTTATLPPPQAPQQSTTEAVIVKRIGELEHIMDDLIQVNKNMKVRLDKHGARLYTLEQLDIPQQVSIAVSEVVTDAVDWAMQAPLRNRFRDLLEADMKEIMYQRMWESDSYKSHEDHMQLFEALKKSMNRDHSEELMQDLAEARKKRKKGHESPKTPPGSPSHQPPPLPPPAGPSGASGAPRASGSQVTPPPPPTSTSQDRPSKGSAASSPSKTTASTEHQAWTTPDVTLKPLISLTPADLNMVEAMGPDEQAQLSDDEDIESAHIPMVNLRQGWWKPFE
nr:ribonuclease H-like domain-containing protein [Tanacetum cinerariifolium]